MADIIRAQPNQIPPTMETRYRENIELGTHALEVSVYRAEAIDALPRWEYLGGFSNAPGGVSTELVVPPNATVVEMRPEAEDCYFSLNEGPATANSPGYIVAGGGEIIGPLSNLNQLFVLLAVGGTLHVMFFREVAPA